MSPFDALAAVSYYHVSLDKGDLIHVKSYD